MPAQIRVYAFNRGLNDKDDYEDDEDDLQKDISAIQTKNHNQLC
jgi:hypothetical protein